MEPADQRPAIAPITDRWEVGWRAVDDTHRRANIALGRADPPQGPPEPPEPAEPVEIVELDNSDTPNEEALPRPRWVPRHLRTRGPVEAVEPAEPVETVEHNTNTAWRFLRVLWDPSRSQPHEPIEAAEVGNTDASVTEIAVENRAPRGRRPRRTTLTGAGCDGHSWRRIGGGGTCQSCNTVMGNFLFQCRTCGHTSCRRCR